jgi:hypothetical protein
MTPGEKKTEDLSRKVYWVIISKNKHSDKFYVGPYLTLEGARNRKINSSGYVVIYPTTERDAQKVRVEYEQQREMED